VNKLHPSFEAQAFHPSFGNEVVAGTVEFQGWALRFVSGDTGLEIPLDRLHVDLGKADDERIFLSDPQQPGLRIILPDASILERRDLPQVERIRERLSARLTHQEIQRRVRLVLYVLGGCVTLAWLGMLATGVMVRSIVARVPPEWERQLGEEVLTELRGEMQFLEDTNRVAQLAASAKPLLRALPGGEAAYQFHIVEDDEPNAFALPGGHILVTTGELKLADRPEELLGTIAHEVAHVTQKHSLRMMLSSGGPFLIIEGFFSGSGGAVGALGGTSALLVSQSFSQEYEMEADDVGWRYLVAANIDPRGMMQNFRKTLAYEKEQHRIGLVPQAFSTHPTTEKRIARLEKKWRKLPNKGPFVDLKPAGSNPP
jgi:Zn-dependent protease with chaperone function